MNAYRYLASHWIDTLRDKRFKLAKPSELNDPFDCVGVYKGNVSRLVAKAFSAHPRSARHPLASSGILTILPGSTPAARHPHTASASAITQSSW
jgi:hypothetical protein